MDRYLNLKLFGKEYKVSVLCAMAFLYFSRTSLIGFFSVFGISTTVSAVIILGAFFVFFLLFTFSSSKNICFDGILVILFCALFFAGTILFHPEYQQRFDDEAYGVKTVFWFGGGIYCYYIIRLFRNDRNKLYSVFRVLPYLLLLCNVFSMFTSELDYDMVFGYNIELAAILFLAQYLYDNTYAKLHLVLSFVCIALCVFRGSRASVIGYVCFILVYFLWKGNKNLKSWGLVLLCVVAAVAYNSLTFMKMVYNLASALGFESRTLYYISTGDILSADTARQERIWPVLQSALHNDSLFTIRGAYGDRVLLSTKYVYSHSIFFEIMLTFGKIIGTAILLYIIISFVLTCKNNKDCAGLLTIAFGSYAICRLMFSYTFWQEPFFWSMLAMFVNYNKRKAADLNTVIATTS